MAMNKTIERRTFSFKDQPIEECSPVNISFPNRQNSGLNDKKDKQDSPQNKKGTKNNNRPLNYIQAATAEAYQMDHRFRNLQNPLEFINNEDISRLRNKYNNLKAEMKHEQDQIAEFSKSIYKKVISRDSEYLFQHQIYGTDVDPSQQFNIKYSKAGSMLVIPDKAKKQDLQRKFKHGQVTSLQQKRQRLRQQKQIPLAFKHIKLIDTPEFQQLKDVQFYDLLCNDFQEKTFSHPAKTARIDPNDKESVATQLYNLKHSLIYNSQYHTKQSYNFMFNCHRQLMFWQVPPNMTESKNEDETMATCAFLDPSNIGLLQMFDFATHSIEIQDVFRFFKLKEDLELKIKADKSNESLEEKYNEAKKRFEEMKQNRLKSKNQRIPVKYINDQAQTNNNMEQKTFDQYFVQDAKDIFNRLQQLNNIRDNLIQQQTGQIFNIMITNIGLQIGKQLFKLLMLVLKGESFPNYSQFLRINNEQQVERKLLELIHLEFKNFKQFDVDGIGKVDIIKKYLDEREKNQRIYESYVVKQKDSKDQKNKRK